MSLDPEQFRSSMRNWPAGVAIATAVRDGKPHGATVNSLTSISLEPALLSISLQKGTRIHETVVEAGHFGLTILSSQQAQLSDLFAGRKAGVEDRFADLETKTLLSGSPMITGGLAWLDCRVVQTVDAGKSTLFIAEALAGENFGTGAPLVYHNRDYWQLSKLE